MRTDRAKIPPPSETQDSISLFKWMTMRRMFAIHIPNGGKRDKRTAAIMKQMGVVKGAPDYLIFNRPPKMKSRVGVAVELKKLGGRETADQKVFRNRLELAGWYTLVAVGLHDAIRQLERLGY